MRDDMINEQVACLRRLAGAMRREPTLGAQVEADRHDALCDLIEEERAHMLAVWSVAGLDAEALRAVEGLGWDAMGAGLA